MTLAFSVEFSSHQAGNRPTEFREGSVRPISGNGKRSSVPARKAVIAGREERSIRVSDFSGPTGSIADGRIRVFSLPALHVEPVERPPEILPLFGRRLYLLALRFRLLGTRVPRRQVRARR
jgi:hypothetical protein